MRNTLLCIVQMYMLKNLLQPQDFSLPPGIINIWGYKNCKYCVYQVSNIINYTIISVEIKIYGQKHTDFSLS
jgi:hypothetical protein